MAVNVKCAFVTNMKTLPAQLSKVYIKNNLNLSDLSDISD